MIITAPNGEKKQFDDDAPWKEILPAFGIFEGWFHLEGEEDEQIWNSDHLVRNEKTFAAIYDEETSGIFIINGRWISVPALTKEEAERRLKLGAFE